MAEDQTQADVKDEVKVDAPLENKEEKAAEKPEEKASEEPKAKEDAKPEPKKAVSKELKAIIQSVEKLSVVELNDLVKAFEEHFGVSAVAVAASGANNAESDAGATSGGSTVSVELTSAGDQKIAVIKAVKEITGAGLKEAKDTVDGAPSILKENVKRDDAKEMQKKIEAAGGSVTLK